MIDCGKQSFSFLKYGEEFTISLGYEYFRDYRALDGGVTDSEDFTSDSEASERTPMSSERIEEEFMVMNMDEVPDKSPTEDELID